MNAAAPPPPDPPMRWGYPRAAVTISVGNYLLDAACTVWWPFIPLYLIEVGARTAAEAVYWLAFASIVQGVTRILAGPLWGVLSDRHGRKLMYLRSVFFLAATTVMFGFMREPWQVVIVLALHGFFSGYDGPTVALLSASVPDAHFKKSLGLYAALRYLGQSTGPIVGALLAIAFSYRDAILISAVLTAAVMLWVMRAAPDDRGAPAAGRRGDPPPALKPFRPTGQLWLAVLIFGLVVSLAQMLRITMPVALLEIEGDDVAGITGLAFALGGLTSAIGVFIVSARFFRLGRLRAALVACSALLAAAFLVLGFIHALAPYVLMFALISLLQAAMVPTANMLIAFNTPAARRGTAFGLGGSAQAVSIALGPAAAAAFAATSMTAGYAAVALFCLALAALVQLRLREPRVEQMEG